MINTNAGMQYQQPDFVN